jgi:hypothetical protein
MELSNVHDDGYVTTVLGNGNVRDQKCLLLAL